MEQPSSRQTFGSTWTEVKLSALKRYLEAYRQIFVNNPRAKYFKTWYVDAFAGSGERFEVNDDTSFQSQLFDQDEKTDDAAYKKGSATIALDLKHPFDGYYFIEKNRSHCDALKQRIQRDYPLLAENCIVNHGEAHDGLTTFLASFDPTKERAVVFLDPFGMSVEWHLISRLAATKAVDLWLLFPHGMGVNRLLTSSCLPPQAWSDKLTKTFGTDEWTSRFYAKIERTDLFDFDELKIVKTANFQAISQYMIELLKKEFAGVCESPIILENSRGTPMYSLCFAVSNENGKRAALNIANSITQNIKG